MAIWPSSSLLSGRSRIYFLLPSPPLLLRFSPFWSSYKHPMNLSCANSFSSKFCWPFKLIYYNACLVSNFATYFIFLCDLIAIESGKPPRKWWKFDLFYWLGVKVECKHLQYINHANHPVRVRLTANPNGSVVDTCVIVPSMEALF